MYSSLQKQTSLEEKQRLAFKYTSDLRMKMEFDIVCKAVPSFSGKKVLDIGTGWGWLCVKIRKGNGEVVGIDPEHFSCKIASLYNRTYDCDNPFVHANGKYLPFKDNTFDLIFCLDVLEHISVESYKYPSDRRQAEKVVAEVLRLLKPSGKFVVAVPNGLFPIEMHSRLPVAYMPKSFRNFLLKSSNTSNCSEPPEVYSRKTLLSIIDPKLDVLFLREEFIPETTRWQTGLFGVMEKILEAITNRVKITKIVLGTEIILIAEKPVDRYR